MTKVNKAEEEIDDVSIRKLRAFAVLAETGSTQATAEVLSASQPGVSRMISQLEEEVGLPLVDRSIRPFRLTHDGSEILNYVLRVLESYDQLKLSIHNLRSSHPSSLRLGLSEMVCDYAGSDLERSVAGLLSTMSSRAAFAPELTKGFADKEFDIVVTSDVDPSHHVVGNELLSENFLIVLPKSMGVYEDELPLAELSRFFTNPFIACVNGSVDRQKAFSILRIIGRPATANYSLENTKAVVRAVTSGLGWTVVPAMSLWSVRDKLDMLTIHPIPGVTIKRTTCVVASSSLFTSLVQVLRDTFSVRFTDTYLPQLSAKKPCIAKHVRLL